MTDPPPLRNATRLVPVRSAACTTVRDGHDKIGCLEIKSAIFKDQKVRREDDSAREAMNISSCRLRSRREGGLPYGKKVR
jgi:hypothetical protein